MAHPVRREWVEDLLEKTGIPEVSWENGSGLWATARAAWQMYDSKATHHLVLQDDAIVCRDLLAGVESALEFVSPVALISLFFGTPHEGSLNAGSRQAVYRQAVSINASWVSLPSLNWGLALVIPTLEIDAMLEWCDQQDDAGDDQRIGRYFRDIRRWRVWQTWPSLVDHREGPSMMGHSFTKAYDFIGAEASALDLDWRGPVAGRRR
jgi:hypothetical protein